MPCHEGGLVKLRSYAICSNLYSSFYFVVNYGFRLLLNVATEMNRDTAKRRILYKSEQNQSKS